MRPTTAALRRAAPHAALLAVALGLAIANASCTRSARGIRVVLIVLDTLRFDSFAGGTDRVSAMPLLTARARKGLVFDRFYAATSSTQPSVASLLTGLDPWRHGVTRNGLVMSEEWTTVAEAFRDAGFHTAAAVASLPVSHHFGFAQGFERFDDRFTTGGASRTWEGLPNPEKHFYRSARTLTDAALAAVEAAPGDRQFFWFHYFDPHAPYGDADGATSGTADDGATRETTLSPPAILRAARKGKDVSSLLGRARTLYDRDVVVMDQEIERLLARLDRDATRFDTHVVVVSDHGESFGEDGSLAHGSRLTPAQIHVPLVVLSPVVSGAVRSDIAGSIDVPATLYSLARLDVTAPSGRDLVHEGAPPEWVLGMRRTYAQPPLDLRLDGGIRLDFALFYAVGADGLVRAGNGAGLRDGAADLPAPPANLERRLRSRFAALEAEIEHANVAMPATDPALDEGLHALGYAP